MEVEKELDDTQYHTALVASLAVFDSSSQPQFRPQCRKKKVPKHQKSVQIRTEANGASGLCSVCSVKRRQPKNLLGKPNKTAE